MSSFTQLIAFLESKANKLNAKFSDTENSINSYIIDSNFELNNNYEVQYLKNRQIAINEILLVLKEITNIRKYTKNSLDPENIEFEKFLNKKVHPFISQKIKPTILHPLIGFHSFNAILIEYYTNNEDYESCNYLMHTSSFISH